MCHTNPAGGPLTWVGTQGHTQGHTGGHQLHSQHGPWVNGHLLEGGNG